MFLGFLELLESIRLLYRIGNEDVVKIRKKSVKSEVGDDE